MMLLEGTTSRVTANMGLPGDFLGTSWGLPGDSLEVLTDFTSFA